MSAPDSSPMISYNPGEPYMIIEGSPQMLGEMYDLILESLQMHLQVRKLPLAARISDTRVAIPVGLWSFIVQMGGCFDIEETGLPVRGFGVEDELNARLAALKKTGLLRGYQQEAVRCAMFAPLGHGIVRAPTGSGKTRMAAGIMSVCAGPWLYLVTNKDLAAQSQQSFDELVPQMTEAIGDKDIKVTCSSYTEDVLRQEYAGVIVDECHGVAARTRAGIVGRLRSLYKVGLSATPFDRQDSENSLVGALLGGIVCDISTAELENSGYLAKGHVTRVVAQRLN